MGDEVARYADRIASVLGAGTPGVAALTAAAADLDDKLADLRMNPADPGLVAAMQAALSAWRGAQDALRGRLADALLPGVPLDELRQEAVGAGWAGADGLHLDARLGPLSVTAAGPPLQLDDPRGGSPLVIGPLPPDTFHADLDAGPLAVTGALLSQPDGLSGVLTASLGAVEVGVLASLRRTGGPGAGGPAFLAVMSAGFTPGIQLGFGFQLNRVGGVVGVERRLDQQALSDRLHDGGLAAALFPLDLGPSARTALRAAEQVLPPAAGSAVAGPTMRLAWLEVAGQGFCSLDVGVLVELPGPRRIVVVGVARAGIPGPIPLLRLRVDVLGVVDVAQQLLAVDAALIDSSALGIFTLYGDAAFRMAWGASAYTVLTIGGFYPGFHPEPAQLPPLRRMGLALEVPVPGLTLRAEGYFAATGNTLQVGGWLEAGISVGLEATGSFGLDAIVQFTPFHVHTDIHAGFRVGALGLTFCGVSFTGTLDGPGPVTLRGRMKIETFLKDIPWSETFIIGRESSPPPVPARRAIDVLAAEEVRPGALRSLGGRDPDVALGPLRADAGLAVVPPRGALAWSQHRLPLDVPIDRIDGAPAGAMQSARASVPNQTGTTRDRFAPGSFITLTAAEALNRPAYDTLQSGVTCAGGPDLPGPAATREATPVVLRKVREEVSTPPGLAGMRAFPAALLAMLAARDRPAVVATTAAQLAVTEETFVAGDGSPYPSATEAHQATRLAGGVTLAQIDLDNPVALAGL